MNRGLATSIGAALVAGVMFQVGRPNADSTGAGRRPGAVTAETPSSGDGPWLASCKYWTVSRWEKETGEKKSSELNITLNVTDKKFDTKVEGTPDSSKTECERQGDGWGIPRPANNAPPDVHEPDIRAIIATVPDPVHSHFALEFDRTIDAIMQAAADNRYLSSNSWLPWNAPTATASTETSATGTTQTEKDREREQQPGLIILKYNPRDDGQGDLARASYHSVVYLFLVAESPSLGVDGNQLRNALRYEEMLQHDHGARLSMGDDNSLAVIGPRWSGSAASLREGIDNAKVVIDRVFAVGMTSTQIAANEINSLSPDRPISYFSFGENARYEADQLTKAFQDSPSTSSGPRIAILTEDNSVFGEDQANVNNDQSNAGRDQAEFGEDQASVSLKSEESNRIVFIRFPREISLLRNAQVDQRGKSTSSTDVPSPYLSLSLKDTSVDDTVPRFSTGQSPLSQETQLLAIAHQLQRDHTEFILISASNILDELFLAQFLRRACPDARVVFYNGQDRLMEHDVDNVQYIGSISVTPFSLNSLENVGSATRAFPDSQSESIYNAASYIFWKGGVNSQAPPKLTGYVGGFGNKIMQAPLWATAVGADGFYPLGILSPCASDSYRMLSNFDGKTGKPTHACQMPVALDAAAPMQLPPPQLDVRLGPGSAQASPSLLWSVLCVLITFLCIAHASAIWFAQYWSPLTRDLAVRQNDQPRRRTVYINIGTAVLFCMASIMAIPIFAVAFPLGGYFSHGPRNLITASIMMFVAFVAVIATFIRTLPYAKWKQSNLQPTIQLYTFFNVLALLAAIIIPLIWARICWQMTVNGNATYAGVFFSYRSLHPDSGVSPVVPVLLLLFGWYLWAIFQTARLRFSTMSRPQLPESIGSECNSPWFVSDCALTECENPTNSCLFANINCLLITQEVLRRFTRWRFSALVAILLVIYVSLFLVGIRYGHMQSLERFLLRGGVGPTRYEGLIAALFYPLIMIALTGWLRMICIWGSLSRGLLEPLERSPLRFAFNRIKEVGWITMLSQSSLHIRWRDMARSGESVRQLLSNHELQLSIESQDRWNALKEAGDSLFEQIGALRYHIGLSSNPPHVPLAEEHPSDDDDMPDEEHRRDLCYIYAIERRYSKFCTLLLEYALIPYWLERRIGFVDDHGDSPEPESKAKSDPDAPQDPLHIRLAEEFVAIRYIALIRSVLVNIRYLMMFVSVAFVLAIIAWNSYPFHPHRLIDWCFTVLLIFLGSGFVMVFAQMHRNAILSRITDTSPNKLGWDFYIRIITFGGVPVLTWFAYQFPEVGGSIFKILQPSLQVIK
jgi:hypothetical protein